ncbi:hypothetical protein GQ55_1G097300 [Panicum hallii var. hallii]|uniref:Uncharacterized protein n=1 Tax=Panicum hallii var. hallii TaxID=1504633 RepID=A0A2T7F423_9POAL|nr:hypothetical protein GQ55_1G097300 [Panicum hallii var. hallii]
MWRSIAGQHSVGRCYANPAAGHLPKEICPAMRLHCLLVASCCRLQLEEEDGGDPACCFLRPNRVACFRQAQQKNSQYGLNSTKAAEQAHESLSHLTSRRHPPLSTPISPRRCRCRRRRPRRRRRDPAVSFHGVREEEAVEPDAGDQGAEARPQHLRRPDRRPPHPRRQGARAARRLVPRVVQGNSELHGPVVRHPACREDRVLRDGQGRQGDCSCSIAASRSRSTAAQEKLQRDLMLQSCIQEHIDLGISVLVLHFQVVT